MCFLRKLKLTMACMPVILIVRFQVSIYRYITYKKNLRQKTIWIQEAPTQIISQLHKYTDLFRCPSVCEIKALQLLHIRM